MFIYRGILLWILLLNFLTRIYAYSTGAPISQCNYLTPKHGYQPQRSKPSVRFDFDRDIVAAGGGEGVFVTLSSLHGQFKGFIVRAEDAGTLEKKGG